MSKGGASLVRAFWSVKVFGVADGFPADPPGEGATNEGPG